MTPKENEYYQARNLFLGTNLTQQQICDLLSINRKTLYLWMTQGSWKQAKHAALHAPTVLADQYYSQLGALNAHIAARTEQPWPTKEESDVIRRLTMTIDKLVHRKNPKSVVIDVMEGFVDTLRRGNRDVLKEIVPHLDAHIKRLFKADADLHFAPTKIEEEKIDKEYADWLAQNEPGNSTPQSGENTRNSTLSFGEGRGEVNGAMIQNARSSETPPEPLSTAHNTHICNTDLSTKNNENGAISTPAGEASVQGHLCRLSPYRIGNTIWVHHITDLDKHPSEWYGEEASKVRRDWAERHMGDTIMYYPPLAGNS